MGVAGQFACEACGKNYRWKPELAGRRAKCACGAVFSCPQNEPGADDDLFDLAPMPEPTHTSVAVAAPALSAVAAIPSRSSRPLSYSTPKDERPTTTTTFGFDLTVKDFYVPIALFVLGTAFRILYVIYWQPHPLHSHRGFSAVPTSVVVGVLAAAVAIGLVVDLVLMFIAILISAKIADMSFGHPITAILKIIAIGTVVPIVRELYSSAIGGVVYIGWGLTFLVYTAMFMYLFDLDWSEARICSAIVWILNIVSFIAVGGIMLHLAHP